MKRFFVFIFVFMLLVSTISAFQFDNVKNIKEKGRAGYPNLEIKNSFGLGKTLWAGELTRNTDSCGSNCEAEQTITLTEKGSLIDSVKFETINEDGSRIEQPIRSYQFYIKTGEESYEVDDYETKCSETGKVNVNGTKETKCNKVKIGSHIEYAPEWIEYNLGDELDAGTYEVKLVGDKKPSRTVDWIITSQGKELDEWAIWEGKGYITYDDFEDGSLNFTKWGNSSIAGGFDPSGNTGYVIEENGKARLNANAIGNGGGTFTSKLWSKLLNASEIYSLNTSYTINVVGTVPGFGKVEVNMFGTKVHDTGNLLNTEDNYNLSLLRNDSNTSYFNYYMNGVYTGSFIPTTNYVNFSLFSSGHNSYPVTSNAYIEDVIYFSRGDVWLNSPINNEIYPTNEVNFNCSATVNGATLKNLSLWTNESGTWEIANTTYSKFGITETSGRTLSSCTSVDNARGVRIAVTSEYDLNLTQVSKPSGSQATGCRVLNNSANSIGSGNYVGSSCNLGVLLKSGENYSIQNTAIGSYNRCNDGGSTPYPITGTYITWLSSAEGDTPNYATDFQEIQNITFEGEVVIESLLTTLSLTEPTLWSCQACDSDGDCGFASENRTVIIDTTAPSVSITYPTSLITYGKTGGTLQLNWTTSDTNPDSCWYSYNGTNTSVTCGDNTTTFNLEPNVKTITFYANDTANNLGSDTQVFDYGLFENSQTYSEETLEGAIEDYYLNISVNGVEVSSANLIYGNYSSASASINAIGSTRIISVENFEVPVFSSNTNVSFYWSLNINDGSILNLTSRNQSVYILNLDNCSSYTNKLFNLTLYDEETLDRINGTIEVYYEIQNVPQYTTIKTLSGEFSGVSNTLVCSDINLTDQNLVYSAEIRYSSTDYAREMYHIQRGSIDELENIELYDLALNDTTEFKITYENSNVVKISDAIIQLQRKYIAEDLYRTIEAPLTDGEGSTIAHIDLNTNKYRAVVVKDGVILDIFENIIFKCENELSGQCEKNLFSDIDSKNSISIESLEDFSYGISSNENGTITVTFSIPSGEPSEINILLTQLDRFGNSTLCNKTIVSSSGSIECTYLTTIGDSYIKLTLSKDGIIKAIKSYFIKESGTIDFLGNNFFIVFIFLLSVIGMAFSSPEWIIVNGVIVMMFSGAVWLLNGLNFVVGLGSLMWLLVGAAILIMKISKQEDK